MNLFFTPWKHKKTIKCKVFPGGRERVHWEQINKKCKNEHFSSDFLNWFSIHVFIIGFELISTLFQHIFWYILGSACFATHLKVTENHIFFIR